MKLFLGLVFAVLALCEAHPLGATDLAGIALFLVGSYLNTGSELQRKRFKQDLADVLVIIGHPVGCEKMLVLPHDRAFETHHGIDPGREFRLRQKGRIGAVLATAIGNLIIDHEHFAVVSQVYPATENA